MSCGPGGKKMPLCPLSFGLALGLTSAVSVMVCVYWAMWFGMPDSMAGHMTPPDNFMDAGLMALRWLVKGFAFGFIFALLYDLIACCCKGMCCKKSGCGCGNPGCNCGSKPDVK